MHTAVKTFALAWRRVHRQVNIVNQIVRVSKFAWLKIGAFSAPFCKLPFPVYFAWLVQYAEKFAFSDYVSALAPEILNRLFPGFTKLNTWYIRKAFTTEKHTFTPRVDTGVNIQVKVFNHRAALILHSLIVPHFPQRFSAAPQMLQSVFVPTGIHTLPIAVVPVDAQFVFCA